jgi:hypothetical protein
VNNNYCSSCGAVIEKETKFCGKCGTPVLATVSDKEETITDEWIVENIKDEDENTGVLIFLLKADDALHLRLDYEDADGATTTGRDVDFFAVSTNKGGYVYLHCFDRDKKEKRQFRIDRISMMCDENGEVIEVVPFLKKLGIKFNKLMLSKTKRAVTKHRDTSKVTKHRDTSKMKVNEWDSIILKRLGRGIPASDEEYADLIKSEEYRAEAAKMPYIITRDGKSWARVGLVLEANAKEDKDIYYGEPWVLTSESWAYDFEDKYNVSSDWINQSVCYFYVPLEMALEHLNDLYKDQEKKNTKKSGCGFLLLLLCVMVIVVVVLF